MSTVETAHKAHVVFRLAEFVRTDLADKPDEAALVTDAVAVIVDRPVDPYWFALLDDLWLRDHVEETIAYDNRTAELSIINTDIAATLWALIYGGRRYCQRCIDSLCGEPHEVAAKAGGRDTCPRHVVVHKPFPDDGVTYCGWATDTGIHEGCGEVWPCSAVKARAS